MTRNRVFGAAGTTIETASNSTANVTPVDTHHDNQYHSDNRAHEQTVDVDHEDEQDTESSTLLGHPSTMPAETSTFGFWWRWILNQTSMAVLLSILVLVLGSCVGIHFTMLNGLGLPGKVRSTTDPLVLDGSHPSGELAWQHITNITTHPHMFNSHENLRVRQYIIDQLVDMKNSLQSMYCAPTSDPLFVLDTFDNTNIMVENSNFAHNPPVIDYYESNNVLAKIQGRSATHEALLISAHFDSVMLAPGVTDDGISIGSMLATLQSLLIRHCRSPFKYDIIFNFNNGEEMGLFGANAFVKHPWIKNVKAFMNLEGTGAAQGTRSVLFRTNSLPIVEEYMSKAPFPHASVIINYLMGSVPSETDYRPYTVDARLPGIDIAFSANRYLYHTPKDDIAHAKPIAAQHMSENILSVALGLCEKDSILPTLGMSPDLSHQDTTVLPVPNFAYFDIAGAIGIVRSHGALIFSSSALLLICVGVSFLKLATLYYRIGFHRLVNQGIRPFFEAMALVWFSFLSVFLAVYMSSWIKHHFNPASSYGRPLLSFADTISLILGLFCLIQIIWPVIAVKLGLRDSAPLITYHELPSEPPHIDYYEDVANQEQVPASLQTDVEHGQSEDANSSSPIQTGGHILQSMRVVTPSGPSLAAWLPFGLLGFWLSLCTVNLVLNLFNISVMFYVYIWAFYSGVACILTLALESSLRRWYRLGVAGFEHEADQPEDHLKYSILKYYNQYFWLVNFVIATVVPFIQTFDLLHECLLDVPNMIAEGLSGPIYDTIVSGLVGLLLLNTLPLLSLCHRRLTASVMIFIFCVLWLTAVMTNGFSPDRPQGMTYMEAWDISNTTNSTSPLVTMNIMSTMQASEWKHRITTNPAIMSQLSTVLPKMELICDNSDNTCSVLNAALPIIDPNLPTDQLITIDMMVRETKTAMTVEGTFVGLPNSRICQLSTTSDEAGEFLVKGAWIDPFQTGKWITGSNSTIEVVGRPTPGVDYSVPLTIYRREFEGQGVKDKRIRVPFILQFDRGQNINKVRISVTCFLGIQVSPTFKVFEESLPDWMMFKDGSLKRRLLPFPFGRAGAVGVTKTFFVV
ncbi:hypothetical protein BATDEDRAFT_34530 [Batrachochytrium dendrobatidis JAM81]|uniref:Peptide hydrolase n=2 Tax=Batrachochytrium dendrobatidis TaxID=109871 RepID=F4NYG1_BATDJ|nr:uncharacterized protein BATDEDRAFT_34530 [Batrachochytrium dendrobatidis JAM81]EGF82016.1 hypothetical protein BATDEDRAFT_34530 [Batrachochytrium dendrobatidis JAM81]|eukprot:XP_006677394.1 hypothetical protein BATDEDRAFT_34530 [Batrachochytrium dendrobatidis JAM81]